MTISQGRKKLRLVSRWAKLAYESRSKADYGFTKAYLGMVQRIVNNYNYKITITNYKKSSQ